MLTISFSTIDSAKDPGEASNSTSDCRAHEVLSHGQIAAIVIVALLIVSVLAALGLSWYYCQGSMRSICDLGRPPGNGRATAQPSALRSQSERNNTSGEQVRSDEASRFDASITAAPPSGQYSTVRGTSENPERAPRPYRANSDHSLYDERWSPETERRVQERAHRAPDPFPGVVETLAAGRGSHEMSHMDDILPRRS